MKMSKTLSPSIIMILLLSFPQIFSYYHPLLFQAASAATLDTQSNGSRDSPIILESKSDQGTFTIKLKWTPANVGMKNKFEVHFIEPETGRELEDITYNFVVTSNKVGQETLPLLSNKSTQTPEVQSIVFSKEGPYEIKIADIDGLNESAVFNVVVTPEFPLFTEVVPAVGIAAALASKAITTLLREKYQKRL